MDSGYENLLSRLKPHGQEHLLRFWHELNDSQRESLTAEIEALDLELIGKLFREAVPAPGTQNVREDLLAESAAAIAPLRGRAWNDFSIGERATMANSGMRAVRDGKVAAFLVAGGQGTRLGHAGPKGTFNIGLPSGKSLFQLQAERLLKLGQIAGRPLPWYIMTSADNHAATTGFFTDHKHFGLNPSDVFFFQQDQLPVVDALGQILLDSKSAISQGPNGNGGCFLGLSRSGALADMKRRGIEWVFIYSVDNALVKMCDPHFVGYAIASGLPAASKAVAKAGPEERVGVFCKREGRPSVIEYSELSPEMRHARDADGRLTYGAGNIAVHLFSRAFLEREAATPLPYHAAHKRIPYVGPNGSRQEPSAPNAWKFELFMFDLFPRAENMAVLEVVREEEFAPVKNRDGVDSPQTARELVLNYAKLQASLGQGNAYITV
jgi:UDP-N-acetylglucosamine/UDP-N-acetylgalactosamine diphosphorylase